MASFGTGLPGLALFISKGGMSLLDARVRKSLCRGQIDG